MVGIAVLFRLPGVNEISRNLVLQMFLSANTIPAKTITDVSRLLIRKPFL